MIRIITLSVSVWVAACGPVPTNPELAQPIEGIWTLVSKEGRDRFFFSNDGRWIRTRIMFESPSNLSSLEPGRESDIGMEDREESWMGRYSLRNGMITLKLDWYQREDGSTFQLIGYEDVRFRCTVQENQLFLDKTPYQRVVDDA